MVFLLTRPSVSAASAVTSLMVEHGTNPVFRASFWLTMVRMRPVDGSTTTTLPAKVPRAVTAARRMTRSSPSTLSPTVGATPGTLALWGSFFLTRLVFPGEGSGGCGGGAADDEIVAIDVIAHGGVDAGDFGFVGELFFDAAALSRRRSGRAAGLQQRKGEERDQQKTLHSSRAV